MRRYPSLSSHQDDIAQLSGPQVALHLAEGDVGVGQGGEHALLRTGAGLQRHARGQRGAAVRRPEQGSQQQTWADRQEDKEGDVEHVCGRWTSFVTTDV